MVYKIYRNKRNKDNLPCPDEEMLVCFSEGKLSVQQFKKIQQHILKCERCAQLVSLYNLKVETEKPVPEYLIEKAKDLVKQKVLPNLLEIVLSIKQKFLEIVKTSGDIIVDNEIIPLPVLRSRQIRELREELAVVKEFQDIRIKLNIEKKEKGIVKITILFFDKKTNMPLKDLRVSLLKGNIELESYGVDKGKAVFDNVSFGKYSLLISHKNKELGLVKLEIV